MRYLDLTLPTVAENLALDEALLNEAEQHPKQSELLRIWESPDLAVVVGRATQVDREIRRDACATDGIPIFRRCSGGASVVAGPGCLMYAVLVSYLERPDLRSVELAHRYVMDRMKSSLGQLNSNVEFRGICDLVIDERKFSGNALRCKRNFFLYHGTVLYDFPLERISRYLGTPRRQPDYRAGREHASFVTNLTAPSDAIREAIRNAWTANTLCTNWPQQATEDLVAQRYSRSSWNLGR